MQQPTAQNLIATQNEFVRRGHGMLALAPSLVVPTFRTHGLQERTVRSVLRFLVAELDSTWSTPAGKAAAAAIASEAPLAAVVDTLAEMKKSLGVSASIEGSGVEVV
jgi:hypothetical protein